MRIHTPEIERLDGKVRLSARVETAGGSGSTPNALWFEVPEEFETLIYSGIESFVAVLYPTAMKLGQDIHLDDVFSPRLDYNIRLAGQVLHAMEPRLFKPVRIHHRGLRPDPPARAAGVGMMFSGGIDAFFTLMRHRPGTQAVPDYTLTHGVFLTDFELIPQRPASEQKALAVFKDLFEKLGLTLATATSNVAEFRRPGFGPASSRWHLRTISYELAGFGIFLSGGLGRLLIASSQPFNAYGSDFGGDFETQTLLSTEQLELVHDGIVEGRTAKTIAVAEWPDSYDTLRVCWWEADGVQNCGRCPKCVRTATTLAAIGRFDRFTTFPRPYRPQVILKQMSSIRGSFFLREIRALARTNGRRDIASRLTLAILISSLRSRIKQLVLRFKPDFRST